MDSQRCRAQEGSSNCCWIELLEMVTAMPADSVRQRLAKWSDWLASKAGTSGTPFERQREMDCRSEIRQVLATRHLLPIERQAMPRSTGGRQSLLAHSPNGARQRENRGPAPGYQESKGRWRDFRAHPRLKGH